MTINDKLTLTPEDLAGILQVSRSTLDRMRRERKILDPLPVSSSQSIRWLASEVTEWLRAGTPPADQWKAKRELATASAR